MKRNTTVVTMLLDGEIQHSRLMCELSEIRANGLSENQADIKGSGMQYKIV